MLEDFTLVVTGGKGTASEHSMLVPAASPTCARNLDFRAGYGCPATLIRRFSAVPLWRHIIITHLQSSSQGTYIQRWILVLDCIYDREHSYLVNTSLRSP